MISTSLINFNEKVSRETGSVFEFTKFADSANQIPFNIGLLTISPQGESILDKHEAREIWIVIAGSGKLIRSDGEFEIVEKNIIYFEANISHKVKNLSETVSLVLYSIWWKS